MCLTPIEPEDVLKVRASIKETFPCWKRIQEDSATEFHTCNEQKLIRGNTYKAGVHKGGRMSIIYKPGFHAFLNRADAVNDRSNFSNVRTVVKFWAKKKHITYIGNNYIFKISEDVPCVVLSEITRK